MEELETTNLSEGNDPETEVETEVQDTEPQLDDDGNPIEDQADAEDDEELDIDGHKVKLPKSVAEKLAAERLMQADYTRKTQELAEQRKAFESERQAVSRADADEMSARANLTLIDHQLSQFSQVNWNQWNDQDPFEAQKAFQQFQLLKDAKQQTAQFLGQKQQERTVREQQESAKRMEEGAAQLAKAIPEWSPAHAAKLVDAGQKHFGLSKDDLDGIDDPRIVIALDAAVKWFEHQTKTKKVQSVQKQQEVKPAATASSRGNPVPPGKLDDRLSADEWTRRRNEQLRKRG